ncbi:Ldh family oxidoreductase [Zeimonas arvi]|uniref:Ldh family oxidoreductase n=1 Tax=Zeimonas arvi TaxID=2498847 RepID=A0A5C8P7E3_9BURK|nr:Ldh family oxidoreductase [Zeimonas arvi]
MGAPEAGKRAAEAENRPRFDAAALTAFGEALLRGAGLDAGKARDVAEVLVEGDLLGHDTHGLHLLGGYLGELEKGSMTVDGDPRVIAERSAVATWDGRRLPGPWLVRRAIAWGAPRAREHGAATVAIRRSHHIACLAAYLEQPARDGLMVVIASSDPAVASVAPFGGTQPVFTPNPLAVGIPASGGPMMIDISASITTNGMSNRLKAAGQRGAHPWWLDADGKPSDDPVVLFTQPPGTILPLGGLDAGHKGYGLALTIEALTGGLAGHGRADPSEGWGATVFVQIYDPAAFAGSEAFLRQSDWVADACHASQPRDPARPVRLPGERGLRLRAEQLAQGVALHPAIMPALGPWAGKLGVALPASR